jgi:hypothetical protein
MEPPKSETLLWAEFIWRVLKEAPDAALAYIALYLAWSKLHAKAAPEGRRHVLELHDAVTVTDSVQPAILNLAPARGTSSTRLELTTGSPG